MRTESVVVEKFSTENGRSKLQPSEASFPFPTFIIFARARWPHKTAAHLASAAGVSERQAKFWLAGTYEPSQEAFGVIIAELFRRS